MAVFEVGYCTREDVKRALDVKNAAYANARIDRAVESAARTIEGMMRRRFYPSDETRLFDWPNYQYAAPWKLWFKDCELASWPPVAILAGTQALDLTHIFPAPWQNQPGPPWTAIELDRSSTLAFGGNSQTPQRSISVQGSFGFDLNKDQFGTLPATINNSVTSVTVNDSSNLAPGAIMVIEAERMLVQDCAMVQAGSLVLASGASTAVVGDNVITTSGSGTLVPGEVILLDSERMLVLDLLPSGAYQVKRGYDGTILAVHSGSTIYAQRSLTVARASLGTAAASHNNGVAVYKHRVPSLIRTLAIAIAEVEVTGEPTAYAAHPSAGGSQRMEPAGGSLHALRDKAVNLYRRNARIRAI